MGGDDEVSARVNEAIKRYREAHAGNRTVSGSHVGDIVARSGDNVPPCPACGAST
jgi:hypothetical protein